MTAQRKRNLGRNSRSLSGKISQVANRLDERKAAARALGLSLGSRIRSGLASPRGLWLSGCAGFLAAEWMHRPVHEPHPVEEQPPPASRRSRSAAMSKTLLLLELALDLGVLLEKANSPSACPDETAEERSLNSTGHTPPSSF